MSKHSTEHYESVLFDHAYRYAKRKYKLKQNLVLYAKGSMTFPLRVIKRMLLK